MPVWDPPDETGYECVDIGGKRFCKEIDETFGDDSEPQKEGTGGQTPDSDENAVPSVAEEVAGQNSKGYPVGKFPAPGGGSTDPTRHYSTPAGQRFFVRSDCVYHNLSSQIQFDASAVSPPVDKMREFTSHWVSIPPFPGNPYHSFYFDLTSHLGPNALMLDTGKFIKALPWTLGAASSYVTVLPFKHPNGSFACGNFVDELVSVETYNMTVVDGKPFRPTITGWLNEMKTSWADRGEDWVIKQWPNLQNNPKFRQPFHILPHKHTGATDNDGNGVVEKTILDWTSVTDFLDVSGPGARDYKLFQFLKQVIEEKVSLPEHTHELKLGKEVGPATAHEHAGLKVVHSHASGPEGISLKPIPPPEIPCDIISQEWFTLSLNSQAMIDWGIVYTPGAPTPPIGLQKSAMANMAPEVLVRIAAKGKIEQFFNDHLKDKTFYDHTFQSWAPTAPMGIEPPTLKAKYNYNQEKFEKSVVGIEHSLLPNIYLLAMAEKTPLSKFEYGAKFKHGYTSLMSLGTSFKDTYLKQQNMPYISTSELQSNSFKSFGLNKYLKSWSKIADNDKWTSGDGIPPGHLFDPIIYDNSSELLRNQYNDRKNIFPMYADLSFQTMPNYVKTGYFAKKYFSKKSTTLKNIGIQGNRNYMYRWFMEQILDRVTPQEMSWHQKNGNEVTKETHKTYDISTLFRCPDPGIPIKFLSKIDKGILVSQQTGAWTNLGTSTKAEIFFLETFNQIRDDLLKSIKAPIASQKSTPLFRCVKDIYAGTKFAHSELLFFRIEKRDAITDQVLQNFYIPQPTESKLINYIDTQIKYGDKYTYKVYSYIFVIGNEYKYVHYNTNKIDDLSVVAADDQNITLSTGPVAKFKVENRPSFHLVETPYTSFGTISVVDKPPMPPDVEIIPFKGTKDKMMFWLRGNLGEHHTNPILILDSDEQKFIDVAQSQGIESFPLGTKLHFKSDDYVKQYQVFKTKTRPKSYKDFATALLDPPLDLKQDAFIDTLEPNTKYYYVFRAVDIHGNISNPTDVYEVELVFNSGVVYPVIKVVDFEMDVDLQVAKNKPMRRFIQIIPSLMQSKMNILQLGSGVAFYPSFGDAFGSPKKPKKFKIRITSKSTGRKFDLNLRVVHKRETDERYKEHLDKIEQEEMMANEETKDKIWLKNY